MLSSKMFSIVCSTFPILYATFAAANGNFCGISWIDAISRCARSCPSGAPSQCLGEETCFSGTPCEEVAPAAQNPPTPAVVQTQPVGNNQQTQSAVSNQAANCGGGNRGNGVCTNTNECCSTYGHCGTSADFCNNSVGGSTVSGGNGGAAASSSGTCGGGNVGNGICPNSNECCSQYGYCGIDAEYCSTAGGSPAINAGNENAPSTGGAAPSVFGTCGNGNVGNGICPNNNECCSEYGFCGDSLEHCVNKVGNFGPNYPNANAPQTPQNNINNQQQNTPADSGMLNQNPVPYNPPDQNPVPYNPPVSSPGDVNTGVAAGDIGLPPFTAPHGTDKTIVGYYAGWQWYDRNKLADPTNLDFKKMQRVNYAFFQFDAEGNIFGTDRWGDPQVLFGPYTSKTGGGVERCSYDAPHEVNCAYHDYGMGIINLAHAAGCEVYPSIGGWTLSDPFPTLAASPAARDTFAKNCVDILSYHGFDGIDIDWEYPGYAEHSGTPADTINFTKMLTAIRVALDNLTKTTGKVYGLTAALPCNPEHIDNIEVSKLISVLSEFNLMAYDFYGSWDAVTGVNAPLYAQGFGNDEFSSDACVRNYLDRGVPRDKLNLGLPWYGRSFKYANGLNQPHGGNDVANWPDDDGTPQYFNIWNKLPSMTQVRDNKSKTQYAFFTQESNQKASTNYPDGLVSFDDERAICDKVQYALDNELGGFIIWELSGDLLEGLRTPLLDITNKKLRNPEFQCCSLHSQEECAKEESERSQLQSSFEGGFDFQQWNRQEVTGSNGVCLRLSPFFFGLTFFLSMGVFL